MNYNFFEMPGYNRISGGVGQPNILGDILGWGILANILLLSKSKSISSQVYFYFNLIIISTFIALTESRTAYFYPIAMLIYTFALYYHHDHKKNQQTVNKLLISSLLMLAAFVIYYFWHQHQLAIINHISSHATSTSQIEVDKAVSVSQRYFMWAKGLMMFVNHPIIGVGWNQYLSYFYQTAVPNFINSKMVEIGIVYNSHNLIVQLLATTGIIGTSIILWLIVSRFRNLYKLPINLQIMPIGVGLIALTHSMFEYPLYQANILLPVLLITCLIDEKVTKFTLSKPVFNLIAILIILFGSYQVYRGVYNYLSLSQAIKPNGYNEYNLDYNVLNVYSKTSVNLYWDDASDYVLDDYIMYNKRTQQNKGMFDLRYSVGERACEYAPNVNILLLQSMLNLIVSNESAAQSKIDTLTTAYPEQIPYFKQYFIKMNESNSQLNSKIMKFFPAR